MNINEENKNNDPLNKIENIFQRQVQNTDIEELSSKSHKIQSPIEILSKYDKNNNKLNIFKANDSRISFETFKTMFKNKNKELKNTKNL